MQSEFQKRCVKPYSSTSIYATKIICGDCGSYFGAKVWHSNSKYRRVIYQCNSKFKGSHFCTTPHLYEPEIQEKFLQAFAQYFSQKDVVIKNCQFALNHLKKQESKKAELHDELVTVNGKLKEYFSTAERISMHSMQNMRSYLHNWIPRRQPNLIENAGLPRCRKFYRP